MAAAAVAAESLHYPAAHREDVVDDYFGTKISDPYRWLEEAGNTDAASWVKAQSTLASESLERLPEHKAIRRRLEELWSYSRTDVPWREAGRIFFTERSGDEPQPALYMQERVSSTPRKILDPKDISSDGSTAVGDYAVSPDGRWLAYFESKGGGGNTEVHVRDLATGREQKDIVRGARGGVSWTFDGGGYFYWAPPARRDESTAPRLEKQLFYHRLGQPQEQDRLIQEWKDDRYLYTMLSDDGRYAFAVTEQGSTSRMHVIDLGNAKSPNVSAALVRLLGNVEARHTPMGTVGSTLYVFTDLDAPRGRVIALDLSKGAAAAPRAVIAESGDVIQWATVAGDRIAIHTIADVQSRMRLFTLEGEAAGEIALPGMGAIGWPVNGRNSALELWYSFESFLSPSTVYHYDLKSGENTAFHAPRVHFDASAYETRQVFFASKDGTRVPMFITANRNVRRDGTNPVLLTSYGANGMIEDPHFRPDIPLWLELGGIHAVANLRGGGEYGEEWHRAGNRENKQNSFDDFIAAAEYLISNQYTVPAKIAIYGHSSGGLLIGAVMTQRPDLFGVALPDAGHYDMLRYHQFTVGAGWIPEYGSAEDPEAFQYLRAYSPLHNIRPETCYPATLILTADHDDTVVPSHSYKFAAALQESQQCNRPILLRISRDASHGYVSRDEAIAKWSDVYSFTAAQLGIPVGKELH
jgi:prolyl oligopeptidase